MIGHNVPKAAMTKDEQIEFLRGRTDALTRFITSAVSLVTPEAAAAFLRDVKSICPAAKSGDDSRAYQTGFMTAATDLDKAINIVAEGERRRKTRPHPH